MSMLASRAHDDDGHFQHNHLTDTAVVWNVMPSFVLGPDHGIIWLNYQFSFFTSFSFRTLLNIVQY